MPIHAMHATRNGRRWTAVIAGFSMLAATLTVPTTPARAQGNVSVVRDAEIEGLLKDYARPIFKAAGLSRKGIEVVLINDPDFNAFVDGRRIFVNTGTIMNAETPNEVIGVLAHECGHLAGGHQQRLREQIARAQTLAIVGSLLGVGAVAGGIATSSDGAASAGVAMAMGSGSAAGRYLLSYRRSEEINADQAAVRFLNATHQSAAGMLQTFERFSRQGALAGVQTNSYERGHPLPRERIDLLEELARKSPYFDAQDPPALQQRHDMARAKVAAFTGGQMKVMQVFRDDPRSFAARYGQAIATHLTGNTREALSKMDGLVKEKPGNPYLHEVRGEMLLALGRANEAAQAFSRAAELDPGRSGLIRARLGFALFATGNPSKFERAIEELRFGIAAEPDNFGAYRELAQAYGRAGDVGNAELVMAQGYFRAGNKRQAQIFAARSLQKLQKGTPAWVRANDILIAAK